MIVTRLSDVGLDAGAVLDAGGFMASVARQLAGIEGREVKSTTFVASTGAEDRALDWLDQRSWRLDQWRSNPVILDNHDPRKVVGQGLWGEVRQHGGRDALLIEVGWDDESPVAEVRNVGHQHRKGIRRASSVGFKVGKRTPRNKLPKGHPAFREPIKMETWWGGEIEVAGSFYEDSTLLELSSATVPMLAEALQLTWARCSAVDPSTVPPPLPTLHPAQRAGLGELAEHGDDAALQRAVERLWPAILTRARKDPTFRRIVSALATIPSGPAPSPRRADPEAAFMASVGRSLAAIEGR